MMINFNMVGMLGGENGRIADLLAEDIHAMAETFYPPAERLGSGWMVFTGIKAQRGKAYPGQRTSSHKLVTISWRVSVAEDIYPDFWVYVQSVCHSLKSRERMDWMN